MAAAVSEEPRVLHTIPGRVRLHLPAWSGRGKRHLVSRVRRLPGVRKVEANPLTGNLLIQFDPGATGVPRLCEALRALPLEEAGTPRAEAPPPAVLTEGGGSHRRARIAVRGLDRDPHLSQTIVERLQRLPGVHRARASPLTSRVLVEFDEHHVDLEDLICQVVDVELPELPGEDRPSHPLDPLPLVQSATRATGAALGLAVLAARRLAASRGPLPGARGAAAAAGVISLLHGFPLVRNGLRRLLGEDASDLFFGLAGLVTLTLSSNPLGLLVIGGEALLMLREVVARRARWRQYEHHLLGSAAAEPGAVIRLQGGERCPRPAVVIEGTGTATGRDGLPRPVEAGSHISAGARVRGGPFDLQLKAGRSFVPQPRPAPIAPSLYDRYLHTVGPLSLAYGAVAGVLNGSLLRTLEALLLVNPRTAVIGREAADLTASLRVLRAGVIVVATRPERVLRLPNILLLDGPRLLTDGVELADAIAFGEGRTVSGLVGLAAAVARAAGTPWAQALPGTSTEPAGEGQFDGRTASATIGGVSYRLELLASGEALPGVERLGGRDHRLVLLRQEGAERPLGVMALRPRLARAVRGLVRLCRQHRVRLGIVPSGDWAAAQALADRAGMPLLDSDDAVARIRAWQREGAVVAFASDSAQAAEAFEACDLAIGLALDHAYRFPARADLLACDVEGLAAILDAGVRRQAAVRDGIGWSALSNIVGAAWGLRGRPGIRGASFAMYLAALVTLTDSWLRLRKDEG